MNNRLKFYSLVTAMVAILGVSATAQAPRSGEQPQLSAAEPIVINTPNPNDALTSELAQLRKTLQSLNTRLRELNPNALAAPNAKTETPEDRQKKILRSLEILNGAEQRAESLRKQLVEAVEKENAIRARAIQVEEDLRPENVDRTLNAVAMGTRAPEQRDARRRSLEGERDGLRNLLAQIQQSRVRLEDDVRQADHLVVRLRQRVLPLIEREVEVLTAN